MFTSNLIISVIGLISIAAYLGRGRFAFGSTAHRLCSLLAAPMSAAHELAHVAGMTVCRGTVDRVVFMPQFNSDAEGDLVEQEPATLVHARGRAGSAVAMLFPLVLLAPALLLLATASGLAFYAGWVLLGASVLSRQDWSVAAKRWVPVAWCGGSLVLAAAVYQLFKHKPMSLAQAAELTQAGIAANAEALGSLLLAAVRNLT